MSIGLTIRKVGQCIIHVPDLQESHGSVGNQSVEYDGTLSRAPELIDNTLDEICGVKGIKFILTGHHLCKVDEVLLISVEPVHVDELHIDRLFVVLAFRIFDVFSNLRFCQVAAVNLHRYDLLLRRPGQLVDT